MSGRHRRLRGRPPDSSKLIDLVRESDLSEEQPGSSGGAPGWDELWPRRRDAAPAQRAVSASPVGGGIPASVAPETGETGETAQPFDLELADIPKVMDTGHADLGARTTSELEEQLSSFMRETLEIEAGRTQVVRQVQADVQALRTEMLAAAAERVRTADRLCQDEGVAEAALETRLRWELHSLVASEMATLRLGEDDRRAFTERTERIEAHLATLAGDLAQLRTEVAAMGTIELREQMDRLSVSVEAQGAETATRADLVALENLVGNELRAVQSEVHSRLAMLDAVVNAVDAATAHLNRGLAEDLTGVAKRAASTALSPVGTNLRAVHDEVAATQRSISELRRRVRTLLPVAPPTIDSLTSIRANPGTPSSPGKGAAS